MNLGWEHAFANNGDESDDDLPSLEELLRIPPRPTISDKASRTEPASQRLDQPALNGVAIQVDRTKSGIGVLSSLASSQLANKCGDSVALEESASSVKIKV